MGSNRCRCARCRSMGEAPAIGVILVNPRGRRYRVLSIDGYYAQVWDVAEGHAETMRWPMAIPEYGWATEKSN